MRLWAPACLCGSRRARPCDAFSKTTSWNASARWDTSTSTRRDLAKVELYKRSGHWEHYHEDMFPPMDLETEQMVLRPMNCPHHILIYESKQRSYRDLPVQIAELGTMYRYERSGALSGLSRVRCMTLNDAHIFCTPDQIKEEFTKVMQLVEQAYQDLGITKYRTASRCTTRQDSDKYVDNPRCGHWASACFAKRWIRSACPMWRPPAKRHSTDPNSTSSLPT